MIDQNKHETHALATACQTGGAYVESLGKTDLASFTSMEWETLVDAVVTAYQDSLRSAYGEDPPF